jgi:vacuolar-type H+-ATPase subunit E/Vma4
VAILPDKIVRREKVISELKKMLDEARKELEIIEKKLKRRWSRFLEDQKRLWESEINRIQKALEYLSTT